MMIIIKPPSSATITCTDSTTTITTLVKPSKYHYDGHIFVMTQGPLNGFCCTFNFSEDESAKEDKDDVDNEETDDSARASAHAHTAHRRHAR